MANWLPLLHDLSLLRPLGQQSRVASACHRAIYSLNPTVSQQHRASYSIQRPVSQQHRASYALRHAVSQQHRAAYTLRLSAGHRTTYSLSLATQHRAPWTDATATAATHRAPWLLLTSAAAAQRAVYHITTTNPVASRCRAPYALLDDAWIQTVSNTPVLHHQGRTIAITKAQISTDEQSPYWLATLTVATLPEHAAIAIGDSITIDLGTDTFTLIVDAKTISRTSPASAAYSLSAISPLALQDAPYAALIDYARASATLASTVVADLIGPVTWALPDWSVPAAALQITAATPLAAARSIVSAIGGLIESTPAGSVVCRARHPVSVPAYASTPPAHALPDSAVISASARMAPLKGYNRITVANTIDASAAANNDTLDYLPDPDSSTSGTVRARLGLARAVLLVHSGHPATVITHQGSVTRTETELAEFVAGQASISYSADTITACTWQHINLGTPAIDPADRTTLSTPTPGYSLAHISYQTTALQWRVALPAPSETVQFILIDA